MWEPSELLPFYVGLTSSMRSIEDGVFGNVIVLTNLGLNCLSMIEASTMPSKAEADAVHVAAAAAGRDCQIPPFGQPSFTFEFERSGSGVVRE